MAIGMVVTAENKVQVFGGASWFMAGIFLTLIGYYHGGTYPHNFVSTWFFVQAAISLTIMGLGAYPLRDLSGSVVPITLAILMPLGSIIVHWPSAATIEVYEIMIIDVAIIFSMLHSSKTNSHSASVQHERKQTSQRLMAVAVGILAIVFFALATLIVMFAFT
ncbi:MAG: DUF998 domain-containing protein [Conexivisphaerales archaeon]